MSQKGISVVMGVLGLCGVSGVTWAEPPQPPSPPQAPSNVKVDPSTPRSARLTSQAASAEIAGDPQTALKLAERAIVADPADPWGYYDKGTALGRIGKVDDALKAFAAAEQRYALSDQWGRSVAIYGGAHVLGEAQRCDEARREFARYSSLVRERDPKSANLAMRYAHDCKSPLDLPLASPR